MMSLKYLLLFALNIILAKSAPECIGCADDSSCHVFDTDLNYKMVGCYGTFTGGGGGLADLCSVHFDPVSAADAAALGFTQAMCDSTPDNEVFFFNEGTSFTQCNTDSGGSDTNGLLGCTGTNSSAFDSGSVALNSLCSGISDFAVVATIGTIIEIETFGQAFTTLDLNDASYGGAICIRGPTPAPTEIPSEVPTAPSSAPSFDPTTQPSNIPSSDPTEMPSNEPTQLPTEPTGHPTEIPSSNPTNIPSMIPSNEPTNIPSTLPTELPSNDPTAMPSNDPTVNPTAMPTNDPTEQPTNGPTEPSFAPSSVPTNVPTDPSNAPSNVPSTAPTDPTMVPSSNPSERPSSMPSSQPSMTPTNEPTEIDSDKDEGNEDDIFGIPRNDALIILGAACVAALCLGIGLFVCCKRRRGDSDGGAGIEMGVRLGSPSGQTQAYSTTHV